MIRWGQGADSGSVFVQIGDENVHQASAFHVRGDRDFRGPQEGGRKVDEAHKVVHPPAALDLLAPSNGERHVRAVVIERGFAAGKRHSVVASHDDDRVVQFAGFFQYFNHAAETLVEPVNVQRIVGNITAHLL